MDPINRTVIVTGGASGIGLEISRLLEERGWDVFMLDRNAQALEEACAELGLDRRRGISCDVSNEMQVEQAFDEISGSRQLDAIVNCAGMGMAKPLIETSAEEFRRFLEVNLTGSFLVSRTAARYWLNNFRAGAIVNITSISGMIGNKGRSAYGASKGGLHTLTMVLANELGGTNIRVNAVAPGPIDTPMTKGVHSDDVRRLWTDRVPLGRYGTPREIAGAVAFLLSDDAAYVNGHTLVVDGGFITAGVGG